MRIWRQASPGYEFRFPQDHGSHPEYRIEWWYYTGNLSTEDGQRFGYQLTFFRVGVDPKPENPSRWAIRDLFMTHLAVSDLSGRRFLFRERMNRPGPGWAGAETSVYKVWNGDWVAGLNASGKHILRAVENGMGVELDLEAGKQPILHGEGGYSRKGSQPGNASCYYSLTRMPTAGWIWLDGKKTAVRGWSWMDHEFGTSFLEPEQRGWDWFSIQFEDGSELMLFQLRRVDNSADLHSGGTLIDVSGQSVSLHSAEFTLRPGETWRSPHSGAVYPVEWKIQVPRWDLAIQVQAALRDQELRAQGSSGVTYWEGAVQAWGTRAGRQVRGRGYLEMTGYTGRPMSSLFE
ncbi:MAG: lipocalin-like domain-containing protein [Acidobacteriota bacterium]